jgi:DNA-binding XRE family transcriptional regulator
MSDNLQSFKTLRVSVPSNSFDVVVTLVSKLGGSVFDDDEEIVYCQPTEEEESVGTMLRGARTRLDLTQKELADRSGLKQSRISEYEKDKRPIPKETAIKLAKLLKTVPGHFYR